MRKKGMFFWKKLKVLLRRRILRLLSLYEASKSEVEVRGGLVAGADSRCCRVFPPQGH